jgi:hypothetical protein
MLKTGEKVVGRMIEFKLGETWVPVIEHKVQGGDGKNNDVSHSWAVAERNSELDFHNLTTRFAAVFEAYAKRLDEIEKEAIQKEKEIQARIDAEVSRQVAEKTKSKEK